MLLPAPVRPTSVTCSPCFTVMEKSFKNVPFPIAEGDVRKFHIAPGGLPVRAGGIVRSGWSRKASMRLTPAMADWMVWISMPRLSMGAKMREM